MNYTEDIDDDSDSIFFEDPLDEVEESAEDYHDELNPKLWDNMKLKPEVKNKLNEIAKAFIDYLDINDDAIEDIVITGSSAGYNYTPYSDLDLHLVIDYDKIHEDCPIVEGFLWSMKAQFNKDHDIKIYGIPVELYAEQSGAGTIHNGLYSLMQNKWVDKPKKIVPPDNDAAVEAKYNELKEAAEKIEDSEVAKELLNKIYTMRKAGLAQGGELSTENLAFKKLRNDGTIEKLKQMEKEQIDKELSLEDFSEDPLDEANEDNRSLIPLVATTLNNIKGLRTADAWEDEDDKYLITIPMTHGSDYGTIYRKVLERLKKSKLKGTIKIVQDLLILHINH